MVKQIVIAGLMSLCLLNHQTLGYNHLLMQDTSENLLIQAVQAKLRAEGLDAGVFDYAVVSHFQLTETERALLESQQVDREFLSKTTLMGQVAVSQREDHRLEGVYRVVSTASGALIAFREEHGFYVEDMTLEELLQIKKLASEMAKKLAQTKDVSSLLHHYVAAEALDNAQFLSDLFVIVLSYRGGVRMELRHLVAKLDRQERRRLFIVCNNLLLQVLDYLSSQSVIGVNGDELDERFDQLVRQCHLANNWEEFKSLYNQPISTTQELLQRLRSLEEAERAIQVHLQASNAYDSPVYQLNQRLVENRIIVAYKTDGMDDFGPGRTVYMINCLLFGSVLSPANGQMKVIAFGPLMH